MKQFIKQLILVFFLLSHIMAETCNAQIRKTASDTLNVSHYIFYDRDEKEVSFANLRGKYVFVEIWSMSCHPCLKEMVYFKRMQHYYKNRPLSFVSICVENNRKAWYTFMEEREIRGTQWIAPLTDPFFYDNQFIAVPRFLLIDYEGNVIWRDSKRPSDPELRQELDKVIPAQPDFSI